MDSVTPGDPLQPTLGPVLVANPSAELYGSDRMMLEMVTGLTARGVRVVVTCSQPGPLLHELEACGAQVEVVNVPVVRKSAMNPIGMLKLAASAVAALPRMLRLIRTVSPTVMVANTLTVPLWLVAARMARVPSVVHVHEAESGAARWARTALSLPLLLARQIVFASETCRRVSGLPILERRRRVRVIHNGVRGPAAPTPARDELVDPIRLVYVGRLSPRKGVDLVVSAAGMIAARGRGVQVDLVGAAFEGYEWYELELRGLVDRLGLTQQVRFHGFTPTVWSILADNDIAVVPSRLEEPFGNTLVEAVLALRPVIASSSVAEAAAGFGAATVVPRDDAEALAHAVLELAENWPQVRRRVEADRERALRAYSPEQLHKQFDEILRETQRPRKA